jgi:transcriptional regulator with XRE-family HTH domain
LSEFGERLRKFRTDKGWNQDKLASDMGLTQASISQFESGTRQPTPALVEKFAQVLEVTSEALAGEDAGAVERERLMRNLKGLSPQTLEKINAVVEMIRQGERAKRQDKKG